MIQHGNRPRRLLVRKVWNKANSTRLKADRDARAKVRFRALSLEHEAIIVEAKSVPCADCGGTFDPICMDFDHRPDEIKVFGIATARGRHTATKLRAEILKCDVVCSNCHRIRTRDRGTWSPAAALVRATKRKQREADPLGLLTVTPVL